MAWLLSLTSFICSHLSSVPSAIGNWPPTQRQRAPCIHLNHLHIHLRPTTWHLTISLCRCQSGRTLSIHKNPSHRVKHPHPIPQRHQRPARQLRQPKSHSSVPFQRAFVVAREVALVEPRLANAPSRPWPCRPPKHLTHRGVPPLQVLPIQNGQLQHQYKTVGLAYKTRVDEVQVEAIHGRDGTRTIGCSTGTR
jgi:hypothetical protein